MGQRQRHQPAPRRVVGHRLGWQTDHPAHDPRAHADLLRPRHRERRRAVRAAQDVAGAFVDGLPAVLARVRLRVGDRFSARTGFDFGRGK